MKVKRFVSRFPHILPLHAKHYFSPREKLMLLLRSLKGYVLYYLEITESQWAGYCFLKRNYLSRYQFMDPGDYIVNPYYTFSDQRGKGIAQELLSIAVSEKANSIWAVVLDTNQTSIHVLKKVGFEEAGYSAKHGWQHCLVNEKTRLHILRFQKNEM